jgi:hypothetical protein
MLEEEVRVNYILYPEERIAICEQCEWYRKSIAQCKKCMCLMKLKTRLKSAKCPIGKW